MQPEDKETHQTFQTTKPKGGPASLDFRQLCPHLVHHTDLLSIWGQSYNQGIVRCSGQPNSTGSANGPKNGKLRYGMK